jgi:hypothetical protein
MLPSMGSSAIPASGQLVHLRQRRWLLEAVAPPDGAGDAALISAARVDDDAHGGRASVPSEHELDTRIIKDAGWTRVGRERFDDVALFAAYARTIRWNCVTATDPSLFQAPFRAAIEFDAYQPEPLRKALHAAQAGSAINGRCADTTKGRVDKVFQMIFGYSAMIDPTTYSGLAMRKSNYKCAIKIGCSSNARLTRIQKAILSIKDQSMTLWQTE